MLIRMDLRSREALKAEAARSWLPLHPLLWKVQARLEAGAYNAPDFSEEPLVGGFVERRSRYCFFGHVPCSARACSGRGCFVVLMGWVPGSKEAESGLVVLKSNKYVLLER